MKAWLIPADAFDAGPGNRVVVMLNEAFGRLGATNEEIRKEMLRIPSALVPNARTIEALNKALIAKGIAAYTSNALYILNWRGSGIKDRDYIVATWSSDTGVKQGTGRGRVHVNDMIPKERHRMIIHLARRLKTYPDLQAYLISGSSLEPDGSRTIFTIRNSAALKIYGPGSGDSLPSGPTYIDLGVRGLEILHKRLIEMGISHGYKDDVFYQINWDTNAFGRETIITLGTQLEEKPE
jgi:hypothetical protein